MANLSMIFILEEQKNIKKLAKNGKRRYRGSFGCLCVILLMFPLGMVLCYMALKDKIWPAYQEVQASNMSKACETKEEAIQTVYRKS